MTLLTILNTDCSIIRKCQLIFIHVVLGSFKGFDIHYYLRFTQHPCEVWVSQVIYPFLRDENKCRPRETIMPKNAWVVSDKTNIPLQVCLLHTVNTAHCTLMSVYNLNHTDRSNFRQLSNHIGENLIVSGAWECQFLSLSNYLMRYTVFTGVAR